MTIRIHMTCDGEDHDVTVDKDGNAHVDPKHHDLALEMTFVDLGAVATPCVACATDPDKHCFGSAASYQEDLNPEDRMLLADFVDDEWRGNIANYAPNLTVDQRLELIEDAPEDAKGNLALNGDDLTPEQRCKLALLSNWYWIGELAKMWRELGLSTHQKAYLEEEAASRRRWSR